MSLLRPFVLAVSAVPAMLCGVVQAQPAAGGKPMMTLQMPATPEPARVTLDPRTTALMVLDFVEDICAVQPSCKGQMVPAVVPFLERVRKAGMVVAYGTRAIGHHHACLAHACAEHEPLAERGGADAQ